jgi:hypothetical protein
MVENFGLDLTYSEFSLSHLRDDIVTFRPQIPQPFALRR